MLQIWQVFNKMLGKSGKSQCVLLYCPFLDSPDLLTLPNSPNLQITKFAYFKQIKTRKMSLQIFWQMQVLAKIGGILQIQWKPLNVIPLGQRDTDNIIQMITISE
jgi:hypothetical protein